MDQDAQQFMQSLVLEKQADVASLRGDMETLRGLDRDSEAMQSKWTKIAVAAVLAAILTVMIVIGTGAVFEETIWLWGTVAVACFGFAIFSFIKRSKFKRTNLEDRRYELCESLLDLVGVDLDHDHPLKIRLDCRPVPIKDKFVSSGKAGSWSVKYYQDPWLQLSGRFLDGTSFTLTKTDLLQKRSKTKRSRSGKIKHKSKTKEGLEVELLLRFKPEKYRHMATLQADASEAIQLPNRNVIVKRLRHTDRSIGLKIAHKGGWHAPGNEEGGRGRAAGLDMTQTIAMMMLSLYQVLQLSKAIDKSAAGGAS